jgi:hypothetical protein
MLLPPAFFAFLLLLGAEERLAAPPSRTIGSVYGKAITASDVDLTGPIDPALKFDSRDKARWELMGRIVDAFGTPIVDRFVERQQLKVSADEIEQFRSEVGDRFEGENLEEAARMCILPWKIERELHRVHGGRVIFQQFGAEALDGRRRLFEDAEKNGDLKFDDADVRHLFYYYYSMKHYSAGKGALDRPWFLLSKEADARDGDNGD